MNLRILTALAAFAAPVSTIPVGAADDPFAALGNGSFTVIKTPAAWAKALFICDATDGNGTYVLGYPGGTGATLLFKLSGQAWTSQTVSILPPDQGAGQIFYPLTGAVKGTVHAFNPAMVDGATTPTISSLTLGRTQTSCRWASGTVLLAITARRTIQITATAPGYRYQAFARSTKSPVASGSGAIGSPTVSVDGGVLTGDYRIQSYSFSQSGYTYRIVVGGPKGTPAGTLTVLQGGKVILTEPLLAYTLNGL